MAASRWLLAARRAMPVAIGIQVPAVRTAVPRTAALAAAPARTWFGFGMPKDADEIASEGQMDKAVWLLEPDNDESQYLVGPERWPAEERLDRESLAKEVHRMAASEPQVTPDVSFYAKMFDLLIKYDDWRGVMAAKDIAAEAGIEFDTELAERVEAYLADAKERSYHQGGNW